MASTPAACDSSAGAGRSRIATSLYEDLIARALAANERSRSLQASTTRVSALATVLREAHASGKQLLHCAWCERIRIGEEWLALEAIGTGQTRISADLTRRSTHGICPSCFERVNAETETLRGTGRS